MSPVGGNNRYASLQTIADLFRASVNDDFQGATNTAGEGLINFNTAPQMLVFMNSAIRDLYTDLRNVGDAELLLDNYLVLNIPPLAQADPAVQVSLDVIGYFNGFFFDPTKTLPGNCFSVERLWERWSSGTPNQNSFIPMSPAPFGLSPTPQTDRMGCWEMRQNAIWMPGCMVPIDLRIRCRITFPDFINPQTLDFTSTYVPILDCQNAIVAKMVILYARRFAPELYSMAVQDEDRIMGKLRLEIVRQMQNTEYQRPAYGEDATTDFSASWMAL